MRKIFIIIMIGLIFSSCTFSADQNPSKTFINDHKALETEQILNIPKSKVPLEVTLKNGKKIQFEVELAQTEQERTQGLMFRSEMASSEGMFFIFENPTMLSFWMKNTFIPLDMIFVDQEYKIVHIAQNAEPCKIEQCPLYSSEIAAQFVLEIKGGESEKFGIKVDDQVILQ